MQHRYCFHVTKYRSNRVHRIIYLEIAKASKIILRVQILSFAYVEWYFLQESKESLRAKRSLYHQHLLHRFVPQTGC